MAIFRVNKTQDYTVLSNQHLKDKELSLRAKGLLTIMLSLPEDWNYSIQGLAVLCGVSDGVINGVLKELKTAGYLVVTKLNPDKTKSGRFEYVYDVYEQKQGTKKQGVEKQGLVQQGVENDGLNKILNNKVLTNKVLKNKYGEFQNVLLTDEEYQKIKSENLLDILEQLSGYIASTGKRYKSHYATILNWSRRKKQEQAVKKGKMKNEPSFDVNELYQKAINNDHYDI